MRLWWHIGDIVDGWKLMKCLGKGGNGTVWLARRNQQKVALKILNVQNPKREAFQRFKDEVATMDKLQGRTGVLPLVDSSLPAKPTRESPAWLAMPIAVPIDKALRQNATLQDVVSAIGQLA